MLERLTSRDVWTRRTVDRAGCGGPAGWALGGVASGERRGDNGAVESPPDRAGSGPPHPGPLAPVRHGQGVAALTRSSRASRAPDLSRAPARDTRSPHTRGRPRRWLWGFGLGGRREGVGLSAGGGVSGAEVGHGRHPLAATRGADPCADCGVSGADGGGRRVAEVGVAQGLFAPPRLNTRSVRCAPRCRAAPKLLLGRRSGAHGLIPPRPSLRSARCSPRLRRRTRRPLSPPRRRCLWDPVR